MSFTAETLFSRNFKLGCIGELWSAPEVLKGVYLQEQAQRQSDVYSMGIIMKEVFTRSGPYAEFTDLSAKGA